jgi:hypothetical protein
MLQVDHSTDQFRFKHFVTSLTNVVFCSEKMLTARSSCSKVLAIEIYEDKHGSNNQDNDDDDYMIQFCAVVVFACVLW